MLVLTRKIKDDTIITLPDGQQVLVRVLKIKGNQQVAIGFDAPPNVNIVRAEVADTLPNTGN